MADGFSMKIDSSEFEAGLDKYLATVIDQLMAGVFGAGEALKGDAIQRAPFKRGGAGGLISTASVEKPIVTDKEIEAKVGFNKVYATKLHEDMTLKIKQTFAAGIPRSQKYLETPMKQNAKTYGRLLADFMKDAS